jgi:hypothetical protein
MRATRSFVESRGLLPGVNWLPLAQSNEKNVRASGYDIDPARLGALKEDGVAHRARRVASQGKDSRDWRPDMDVQRNEIHVAKGTGPRICRAPDEVGPPAGKEIQ